MLTLEKVKSSMFECEIKVLDQKIKKLEEELKLERDINSFDRKIRTKNYDL